MRLVSIRGFFSCLGLVFFCYLSVCPWLRGEEKLKPEEVVAKSLEALGTPEARAAAKTRVMNGAGSVEFLVKQTVRVDGTAQFASDAGRTRLDWTFGHSDYAAEQLVFDGKRVLVGDMRPGLRSPLAIFVNDYAQATLKEGLLGGVTNVGWPLLSGRKLRLKYRGLEELRGKKVHVVRYESADGGRLHIDLGFDPQTYRHVITEYRLNVRGSLPLDYSMSIPGSSAASRGGRVYVQTDIGQTDIHWQVDEEFDDFRPVDGITLPHAYKLRLSLDSKTTWVAEWKAQFSEVKQNQDLGDSVFTLR
jgi:hypothetical protein